MATKYADLCGIVLLQENFSGNGVRQMALCSYNTPAYTASTDLDSMTFSGEHAGSDADPTLATAIQDIRRDGKTVTLRGGMCVQAGLNAAGTAAIYAAFVTTNPIGFLKVSSGTLLGSLTNAAGADTTATASSAPLQIVVAYDLA